MTSLHDRFGLTRIINAGGTFTPLGVSRSSAHVVRSVAEALASFFVIEELHDAASAAISRLTGAEAATVTHCVAAGITLSVAAAMTGEDAEKIAALPDATGLPNRVVLPAGHAIDYGHPILTDIRLAGARPVLAGGDDCCTRRELEDALAADDTACLLLVSSRLVRDRFVDLAGAVALAHRRGVPAIIDGAAQDLRIRELLATGADLVLVSAHKYMASPTAGLIIGRRDLVHAARAQGKGIGRAMKASKESILGVLAACDEREGLDIDAWREAQERKVAYVVERANALAGMHAAAMPDPAGMPFSRVLLTVEPARAGRDAIALARDLRNRSPSVRVMEHLARDGKLMLELVPLDDGELDELLHSLAEILSGVDADRPGA